MRRFSLSPRAYRQVTLVALLALAFIIVTGGAVRLTGSGLGCPEWPTCTEDTLTPRSATDYHAMVEFVNRTVTGLVSVAVMLAVLGSLVRVPRRRDLVWLSLGLVGGVIGQIVLGGLTVLFHLWPPLVMGHFLLSMVLLWNAVVLHHRAGDDAVVPVSREEKLMTRLVVVAAAVVVFTGTIVTATGPHGGDEEVDRLPFLLPDVARIHGVSVLLLLLLTVVTLRRLTPDARPRGAVFLAVLLGQAAIGYVQYFTGVPVVLVGLHIAGAVAVWTTALRFHLGVAATATAEEPATAALAGV
jgi:cytochrome c oxidase assembly protein subunit 15